MTNPDLKPGETVERWTYIGRRRSAGKLLVAYLDPQGREVLYVLKGKVRHRTIGGRYDVVVGRAAAGELTGAYIAGATYVAEDLDQADERLAGWAAEDRAAYTAETARKREEAAKREAASAFGDLTLNDVAERMARLPTPQRTALLANVLAHVGA